MMRLDDRIFKIALQTWLAFRVLFESDKGHLPLDVEVADGSFELIERDDPVVVGVGLGNQSVRDVHNLLETEEEEKHSFHCHSDHE